MQTSTLQWRMFICALLGTLKCQAVAGCVSLSSVDAQTTLLCPHRNFFNLFNSSAAAESYCGAATLNGCQGKYCFAFLLSNLASCILKALHCCLFNSPPVKPLSIWWRWNIRGGLFGKGKEHIELHLGKHLSFRHIRCPVGLCGWLKQTSKSFPWLMFFCQPLSWHILYITTGIIR